MIYHMPKTRCGCHSKIPHTGTTRWQLHGFGFGPIIHSRTPEKLLNVYFNWSLDSIRARWPCISHAMLWWIREDASKSWVYRCIARVPVLQAIITFASFACLIKTRGSKMNQYKFPMTNRVENLYGRWEIPERLTMVPCRSTLVSSLSRPPVKIWRSKLFGKLACIGDESCHLGV